MEHRKSLPKVFIGWDSRESVAADVCAHSIRKRASIDVDIQYLKHRELRKIGLFRRPWSLDPDTGNFRDGIDGRPFSTEFSHTRFLVPEIMRYQGWAIFMDSDMVFMSDIKKLFDLLDPAKAVMVVKHNHNPDPNLFKMDGREQARYRRKNWSSFIAFNCSHEANRFLTKQQVNFMSGSDLHQFSWLPDSLIGDLPYTYNYISGVSPKLPLERFGMPDVIHYTEGGPWFEECQDVPYADTWQAEYEDFQKANEGISHVPSIAFDTPEVTRK